LGLSPTPPHPIHKGTVEEGHKKEAAIKKCKG
jgi:hypothetical protein